MITVQVVGSPIQQVEASDVASARRAISLEGNYSATVNGSPASNDTPVPAYGFVAFSPAVKGGR